MVGHQFYTHLKGVPVQVVKHSPSATYISHLYNCWRCHSLPTFLLLQATISVASGHLELRKGGRRWREQGDDFTPLLLSICIITSSCFYTSLIQSLIYIHCFLLILNHISSYIFPVYIHPLVHPCTSQPALFSSVSTVSTHPYMTHLFQQFIYWHF